MKRLIFIALMVVGYGCGGGGGSSDDRVTLSDIQRDIFKPKCAPGCHEPGGTGYEQTRMFGKALDLSTATTSYESLVSVPASLGNLCGPNLDQSCGNRVAPGNPDASWLINKLEGNLTTYTAFGGDQMPSSGDGPLTQKEIDDVRQWISEGAQNN